MHFLSLIVIFLAAFGKIYSQDTESNSQAESSPQIYYPSFCRQLTAISCLGDSLELNDGSVWTINPSDAKKVFLWSSLDPLIIYPVKNIFSYYHYKIQNLVTNDYVEVDLELAPLSDSEYTQKILSIDIDKLEIKLSDNSKWKLNLNDDYKYQKWAVGDLIIVGMNVKTFLSSDKFILINTNINDYCTVDAL